MQINNTKKNICYRRNERREAIKYLQAQLEAIGENEATFGVSLTHVYQDMALLHFELEEYAMAMGYADMLIQAALKTATKSHN